MKRLVVFLLFICKLAIGQPPVNNQCINATTISIPSSGTACANGTLTGATDDGSYAINCERPNVGEVWFAFVALGSNNQVTVRPIGSPAARNLAVVLRADSCNGPLSTCDSATTANGSVTVNWAYPPGKTVYVSVSSNTNSGGTFEICVTSIQQPPVGGKDCSTAELLCTKNSFTTSIAPGSNGFQPPCFTDPLQRPIIYKFTVGVSGLLNWRAVPTCTTNPNTTEFDWAVYNITNGCPGTLVSCNYNFTGNPGFPPLIPPSPPITSPQGMQGGTNANNAGCSANPPNTPAGEICAGVNVVAGNTYVIYIDQYTSSSNCTISFDFNGSTFEMAPFARFTASDTVGCGSLTTTFTNTSVQGVSYLWNFDDGTTSTLPNPPAKTFSSPGTYLVSLTATSASGCVSVATKTILVKPQPTVTVNNDTICSGSGLQATLTATPSISGGTFSWNPGGQNTSTISVQPTNSTNYTVTYNLNGCTASGVGRVTVVPPNFTVDAQRDTVICGSQSTRITAVPSVPGNYTYRWSPAVAISDSTSPNPIVSPNITTRYTVTVRNSQGCVATDTVLVGVVGQGPSVKARATPPIICPGQTTTLSFVFEPRNCGINNSLLGTGSTNVIGDIGTSNSIQSGTPATSPTVYGNFVQSTRNQYLYRASELAAAIGSGGRITAIGFYIGQFNSNATLENFTIKMACTNDSVLNQFTNTGLQTVFGPVSYVPLNTPITGLNLHNLTNFFDWDGQSNIIVDVCWSNNTNGNANNKGRVTATSYNSAVYSSGATNQCGVSGGIATVQRPNTRFIKGTQGYDSLSWVPHTGVNAVSNRTALSPTANPVFTQTYTINVYNKGCVGSDVVTVTVDTSLRVNAGNDTTICPGGTAQLNASVSGNLGSVSYSWSPTSGLNNPNIANPRATPSSSTSYVVLATSSGCQTRDTVNVIVNPPVVNVVGTNVSCFNGSNGTVTANVSGGTPPYTFAWSNGAGNVSSQSNLAPATYTVTVTDAKGCTATGSYTVSQPPQLSVSQQTVRNVLCNGGNTGFISVTVSGGTPGYNFTWNPPNANNDTIENLPANTYQLTVTDANNCTATRSFTITQPTALAFGNATTKNIRCRGGSDGSIIVSASGGTGSYTYAWSHNPALNGAAAFNLSAGNYITTVTDQNGCTATQSNTLLQPSTGISFNPFTVTPVSCFGGNDGSVRANPTGGLPPYSFQWNVPGNTNQISGLTAGTYRVTVTDDSLCTAVDSAVVSQPPPIVISGSVLEVSCFGGSDGQISVSATPTGVPYTFQWSNGASGANVSNLNMGNYTVTATNPSGCTALATFNVSQPLLLVLNAPSIVNVSCFGGNSGSITANPSGGTPNYTFSWSNNPLSSNALNGNLSAGNYQVTVTDAKGCTATAAYNVMEPSQLIFAQTPAIVNVLCYGASTGSIAISVSGGTPAYNYSWSNGLPNQPTQQNLPAGTYSVTVSDVNGCSISNDFTIEQPPAIVLQTQVANHVTCGGGSDGKAWAVATGGVGNFSYTWSNGNNSDTAFNLAANVLYTVTTTDANQCTKTATISVTEPSLLSVNPVVKDVSCFLGNDGSIDANPSGGTPPYSFNWSNGSSDQIAQSLSANAYSCTVTDRNNCSTTFSRIVSQPGLLQAVATGISESCVGTGDGKILMSANGGVKPYSFAYTLDGINVIQVSGDTAFNLKPTSYSVIVTDGNNCTASTLVNVGSPAVDVYAAYADTTSCYGTEYKDGRIRVSGLTTSNAPYRFQLNDSGVFSTSGIFENLASGMYKIYAVNNFGCDTAFTIEVPQPLPASVDIVPDDTTLLLGESIQLFGYLKPYGEDVITAYSWTPSTGLSCVDCFNPLALPYINSNYQLTIFYKNGCFAASSVRIKVLNNEELFVPNLFSPNGDGVNEKFEVFGYGIKDFSMKIFNRWGEKIFESDNQYKSWDGTYKGVLQNPDTYAYVLRVIYLDDKEVVRKGTITLVR
jgi:gliding motility-associated-like protein